VVTIEKELHIGIMTNQELADWFGIKERSLSKDKKRKLQELKEYAEFESLWGKVNITKIFKPVYTKYNKTYKFVKEKTFEQWSNTGLDTCKLVKDKIKRKYENKLNIKETTLYTYTCESKRELWGKAYSSTGGEKGSCIYELCKQVDNECIEFTEEEQAIKQKLLSKYFGKADEKIYCIKDMIATGEITEEDGWQELKEIINLDNSYLSFKTELESLIGCKVVRATRVTTKAF